MPSIENTPSYPAEVRLDDSLGYQLARATQRTRSLFLAVAATPLALRPVEYAILSSIHAAQGITVSRLGEELDLNVRDVVILTAKLEERGYVALTSSEGPLRSRELALTDEGARLFLKATSSLIEAEHAAFSDLCPGEYLLLNDLLRKIAE